MERQFSLLRAGQAAVLISVIHIGRGRVCAQSTPILDGQRCTSISSRILPEAERPGPVHLTSNQQVCFSGSYIAGQGFFLSEAERNGLLAKDPSAAPLIQRYMGGDELVATSTQEPDRWVINFGAMTLEHASRWSGLIGIVRDKVKPYRESTRLVSGPGGHGKKYWWQFISRCDPLYEAIRPLSRCLLVSQVTKHVAFAWQPTDRVLGSTTYVVTASATALFTILQSRAHEVWVRLLSSTMGERVRYTPSDSFETFPFPTPTPAPSSPPSKTSASATTTSAQRTWPTKTSASPSLTTALKIQRARTRAILELRRLNEEMDRQVLAAYAEGDPAGRWLEVQVPPFCPPHRRRQKGARSL